MFLMVSALVETDEYRKWAHLSVMTLASDTQLLIRKHSGIPLLHKNLIARTILCRESVISYVSY